MRARTYRCDPCGSRMQVRSNDQAEFDELQALFRARHQGHGAGTRKPRPPTPQQKRVSQMEVAGDLCRKVVFHRDGYRCRRCKRTPADGVILQWAHVQGRANHAVFAEPDNSMVLCSGCHKRLTERPNEERQFFMGQLGPTRYQELEMVAMNGKGPYDWKAIAAWLRQELRSAGADA